MVSEFIRNRLDMAHGLIDEGRFGEAVNLLKNLKLRVHENPAEEKITQFENEKDSALETQLKEIEKSEDDPLRKEANAMSEYELYAKAYLNFYSNLTLHHDI